MRTIAIALLMRGWLLLLGISLLYSCAQVATISGGEKDEIPPTLVNAIPANGSVRFNSSVIRLNFDERIKVDRFRDRALISPPLDAAPDVRVVGSKAVEVRLNAPLRPNTTYTFNLGGSIVDLTEGNTSPALNYVFSTGDELDSLGVVGAVVNAFTGAPEKDLFVLLYATTDTNTFREGRPTYMARSLANGTFAMGHLPEGSYRMYALRDKNANLRYDLPNEEVAFLDSVLYLQATDSVTPIILRSFLPQSEVQLVRSSKVISDGALQVILARATDTLLVQDIARIGGSLTWQPGWNTSRDTVLLWPSDTTLISEGYYQLSDATGVLDTVKYRPLGKMPFNTKVTATLMEDANGGSIRIHASRPIDRFDSTRVKLTMDSVPIAFTLRASEDPRSLTINASIDQGSSVALTLLPKFLHDIYGGTNDTLRAALGRAAETATGSLRITLKDLPSEGPFILQLMDQQQRVVRSASVDGTNSSIVWKKLAPGLRSLRLIDDANSNGRWDTGVPDERQPEQTWYHLEPVNIRAAWDIAVDWSLDPTVPSDE